MHNECIQMKLMGKAVSAHWISHNDAKEDKTVDNDIAYLFGVFPLPMSLTD